MSELPTQKSKRTRKATPNMKPETLHVVPLEPAPIQEKSKGRPRKPEMPPLPDFRMAPLEEQWFHYFIDAFRAEHPDLTPTDLILLQLAAIEYIKYLRVAAQELETGQVISMARQHPGTNFRALLDQLSVTRKARQSSKTHEDDPNKEKLLKFFGS